MMNVDDVIRAGIRGDVVSLVTHRNCMDGSMCAAVMKSVCRLVAVSYVDPHTADDFPDRGSAPTIFADVCPRRLMDREAVVDHHKTSFDRLSGLGDRTLFDTSQCACRLLFERVYAVALEEMQSLTDDKKISFELKLKILRRMRNSVEIVDDYDRLLLSRPLSRKLASLHQFIGQEEFSSNIIEKCRRENFVGAVNDWAVLDADEYQLVERLEEFDRRYVDQVLSNSWTCSIKGETAVAYLAEQCTNDLSAEALRRNPDAVYTVCVNFLRGSVSMRSRDPAHDCAAIAAHFDGGGHAQSAGFPIPSETIGEIKVVFGLYEECR